MSGDTMSKIAFIASDKLLFEQGKSTIKELDLQDQVALHFARLDSAVKLTKQLKDVDVIIARGGTAQLIIESNLRIPVVEVVISGQDLAQIFQEAKNSTNMPNPKFVFIAFDNMATDVETLADILGINLTVYRVTTSEDISKKVDSLAQSKEYDILIGGKMTAILAKKRGLKCIPIRSGNYSIKKALLEAQKIALGRKIEKENAEKFKAFVDYSLEGIISIDHEKIIRVFNPSAERLLNCKASSMLGQKIDIALPFLPVNTCLKEQQKLTSHVLCYRSVWLTVNIAPIIIDQTIIGVFITFQDITHIQEAEAKIRNEVVVRKFTAKYHFSDIIGRSPQIMEAKRIAAEMAKVDATILIIGDSGTGKELFAQSIHNNSSRKNNPFVAINCAALPPSLLESELFGYVEGAFTGATKKGKVGLFELAHKGTIFLDEISEMDKYGQSRLLRVIQERQVMRLGDDKYIPIDVRIIAATNRNLETLINKGDFRQDLYYRLKVLVLNLPVLYKRIGDIEYLAYHFLRLYNHRYGMNIELLPEAYNCLKQYPWPGNIRELTNFMERLIITVNQKTVTADIIQKYFEDREYDEPVFFDSTNKENWPEDARIIATLESTNYNIKQSAQQLGIARSTLYQKLKEYKIQAKKRY